ncbi:TetR/AcrR family transcriptional regulator [Streptomyces rectiverticillatus]|uniref:TetR/AcrR family transcriptional regulator n=1 Tax=Streptomyces rectiverticillatus TaxID=173860 RepID=UPI001FEB7A0D|nr:TetR family transcriptional regulator [Streptomyces rectiverticillatus]
MTSSTTTRSDTAAGGNGAATRNGATTGLRGRKRERTRRAIAEAAFRLFAEEGFDAVTLTRIAAAADVAPATVFTHYASKEDIFFGRREEFEAGIAEAVAGAATAVEVVDGVHRACAAAFDAVLDEGSLPQARTFSRILLNSPALRRSYLPLGQTRREQLLDLLLERAGERAADPGIRAELEVFASLTGAVRELSFDALHAALAADEPAERVREAAHAALDRGCDRLACAYADAPLLDAG